MRKHTFGEGCEEDLNEGKSVLFTPRLTSKFGYFSSNQGSLGRRTGKAGGARHGRVGTGCAVGATAWATLAKVAGVPMGQADATPVCSQEPSCLKSTQKVFHLDNGS